MAGTVVLSTLNDSSGVLATQNGMTGIAKAWVQYNATTQTIVNSFNVSSVTYVGTGNHIVNFTTAMPNANYVPVCMAGSYGSGVSQTVGYNLDANNKTTSAFQVYVVLTNIPATLTNIANLSIAFIGN